MIGIWNAGEWGERFLHSFHPLFNSSDEIPSQEAVLGVLDHP